VSGSHTYDTVGTYVITVKVVDDGGSTVTLTGTATVVAKPVAHAKLTRVGKHEGNDDSKDKGDDDESKGLSGLYIVGATCDNGTLVSAMLNGVPVTNGQKVLLKFSNTGTGTGVTPGGTVYFRGSSFTLVVTCKNAAGMTATDTYKLGRDGKSDKGDGPGDKKSSDDKKSSGKGKD
jgi:hypothetical protein